MEIAAVKYKWLHLYCASLPLGSKYLHCIWVKGKFHMNAYLVIIMHRSLSLPPPPLQPPIPCQSSDTYLGLPNGSKQALGAIPCSSGGTGSTGSPPRKWVTVYQKPLTNNFIYILKASEEFQLYPGSAWQGWKIRADWCFSISLFLHWNHIVNPADRHTVKSKGVNV